LAEEDNMTQGCRLSRHLVCLLLLVAGSLPPAARGDPFLGRLDCVSLLVNVLESGEAFGVTPEVLRDAVRTGLKSLVPTLKLEPSCPDQVAFKVFIQSVSTGPAREFFGHAALEVRRKAIFRDTALLGAARAWDLETYLHGPGEHAKSTVLKHLNRLLAQFADDYRAANTRRE
jgi:hypothetical protein